MPRHIRRTLQWPGLIIKRHMMGATLLDCTGSLDSFGIADNIKNLLTISMRSSRTQLFAGGEVLGEVDINRGIFQGDSLSPLLFVISLIPLSLILRRTKLWYEFNGENISH